MCLIRHNPLNRLGAGPAATLFFALPLAALAVNVGWHDQMSIQLGDGVDLKRQYEAKAPLVIMGGAATNLNSGGALETVRFVQSTYDMVKTLSVNSSVSLNFEVFSGNGSGSFVSRQSFHDNELSFMYTATRNFGQTFYSVQDFTPDFKAVTAALTNAYQGQALHSAITGVFGTHYVHGYQSSAMVWVVYSFHFASASDSLQYSQQYNLSGSEGDLSGSFSASVNAFFATTNTTRRMSYQFYSSDPYQSPTNFNFSSAGTIQSVQAYTNFLTKVQAYWRAMNPARGKVTGYILDPIEILPGYLQLLAGYIPPPLFVADYDTFLQVYTTLQAWNQRLTDWTLDQNKMNWLNATGRQMALGKRANVANFVAALRSIATDHFQNGGPLLVPTNVTSYLGALNDIPIPAIYVLQTVDSASYHFVLGWVDCGPAGLSVPSPFNSLSGFYNEADVGALAPLVYSPADFLSTLNAYSTVILGDTKDGFNRFLAVPGTSWTTSSNAINRVSANNPGRTIGFFSACVPHGQEPSWSLAIRDLEGNTVDEIPFLSTRTGGTGATTTGAKTARPIPTAASRKARPQ